MTLFTSDTDKKAAKTALIYLGVSLFCVLFGGVYELFSHGVYSYYMIYAFVFPLAGGTLPALAAAVFGCKRCPAPLPRLLYHCGIATFTAGSILQGVLQIYGTSNPLTRWYWPVATFLVAAGLILHLLRRPT